MTKAYVEVLTIKEAADMLDYGYDTLFVNPDAYAKVIKASEEDEL